MIVTTETTVVTFGIRRRGWRLKPLLDSLDAPARVVPFRAVPVRGPGAGLDGGPRHDGPPATRAWDPAYGAGIVDAAAVLAAGLPELAPARSAPPPSRDTRAAHDPPDEPWAAQVPSGGELAGLWRSPGQVRDALTVMQWRYSALTGHSAIRELSGMAG